MKIFTEQAITIIKSVPFGKVLTYGKVAALAGNPKAARQIAWLLSSSTKKYNLPWHRIINAKGKIVMSDSGKLSEQKVLLENEGVEFINNDTIDLEKYIWEINSFN